jgi:hypothetical protein
MNSSHKKALLLLKAIIFLYHDFTEEELRLLKETASSIKAEDELEWAMGFIQEDIYTAYERTRDFLKKELHEEEDDKKIDYLFDVWLATNQKGYITEMEALAMIKLARDWGVETEFIKKVRKK